MSSLEFRLSIKSSALATELILIALGPRNPDKAGHAQYSEPEEPHHVCYMKHGHFLGEQSLKPIEIVCCWQQTCIWCWSCFCSTLYQRLFACLQDGPDSISGSFHSRHDASRLEFSCSVAWMQAGRRGSRRQTSMITIRLVGSQVTRPSFVLAQ